MYRRSKKVCITPDFLLLLFGAVLYFDALVLVALTLFAAVFHEMAHYAALRWCDAKVERLCITAFGAEMVMENPGVLSYGKEMLCAAAGPLGNMLSAGILGVVGRLCHAEALYIFAGIHAVQAIFNLIPFPHADGGRILLYFLSWCWGPEAAEKVSGMIGALCCTAALGLGILVVYRTGGNGFLLVGALGLTLPAVQKVLVKKEKSV